MQFKKKERKILYFVKWTPSPLHHAYLYGINTWSNHKSLMDKLSHPLSKHFPYVEYMQWLFYRQQEMENPDSLQKWNSHENVIYSLWWLIKSNFVSIYQTEWKIFHKLRSVCGSCCPCGCLQKKKKRINACPWTCITRLNFMTFAKFHKTVLKKQISYK